MAQAVTVTFFIQLCTTCMQAKEVTTVPLGLLQPLLVPESRFSSWIIDLTTDLPISQICNISPTCMDCLIKYTIFIPYKMGD